MKIEEELKTNFKSNHEKAVLNILFTSNWIQGKMDSILKPFGISHQQYNVLRILRGKAQEPSNLQDISNRMIDRMSNATRLVEKLRLKGFVTREICPANRRKVEILITEKGLQVIDKIQPSLQEFQAEVKNELSEEEALLINTLLDRIRN
jgi:DNA-binding MarR family transcriptional regulator